MRRFKLEVKLEETLNECETLLAKGQESELLRVLSKTSRLLQCYFPAGHSLALKNAHLTAMAFFNTNSHERCETLLEKHERSLESGVTRQREQEAYLAIFKLLLGRLSLKKGRLLRAKKKLKNGLKIAAEIADLEGLAVKRN